VPCAGTGARAVGPGGNAALPKQYQLVAGQPLVLHTLAAFAGVARLAGTLVAVAPGDGFFAAHTHPAWFAVPCGGAARADSVLGGLKELQARGALDDDWALVHDAARCLVTTAQIDALIDACEHDAVGGLLAHKLADTLKTATDGPGGVRVAGTVDRSDKWLAQTPQMFRIGPLLDALQHAGAAVTDEASAMEAVGQQAAHGIVLAGAYQRIDQFGRHQAACGVVHQHPVMRARAARQQRLQAIGHGFGPRGSAAGRGGVTRGRQTRQALAPEIVAGGNHHQRVVHARRTGKSRQRMGHHGRAGHQVVLLGKLGGRRAGRNGARTGAGTGDQGPQARRFRGHGRGSGKQICHGGAL
jgi:2-C-methyl-D-erythritol 4-phosphate cytidylyltransferase